MNGTVTLSDAQKIIETAWRNQAIWSETANQLKAELTKWRNRAVVAGVLGAFLETLAAMLVGQGERWWWIRILCALIGAVILSTIPYIVQTKTSKDRVRDWVFARSASEALKGKIYRYLLGVEPFGPKSSPSDLIKSCQEVKERVQGLSIRAALIESSKKIRPLELNIDGYIENRVKSQIERYYRPKSLENARAADKLHNWEFYLGLTAVIMGALASAAAAKGVPELSVLGPWVAVVTTAGAAVTAHTTASRYDHQAMIYCVTADRLESLYNEWLANPHQDDPTTVARFVIDCENTISMENESWIADWTREETKK